LTLEKIRRVVQDDETIYPLDNTDQKRKFLDLIIKLDLITLSADPQGKLKGFLISYRSCDGDYLSRERPEAPEGNSVVVDVLWIRPDLRDGKTLKELIRLGLQKNRANYAGAEKIFMHVRRADRPPGKNEIKRGQDIFRAYDYPKFFRKYA